MDAWSLNEESTPAPSQTPHTQLAYTLDSYKGNEIDADGSQEKCSYDRNNPVSLAIRIGNTFRALDACVDGRLLHQRNTAHKSDI